MKRGILVLAVLGATMSGGAQAALKVTGTGGFVQGSDSDFTTPNAYFGCADGICTTFGWGTAQDPDAPVSPFTGSGASINTGIDATKLENTPSENAVVVEQEPGETNVIGSLTHWNLPINAAFGPATVDVEYDFLIEDTITGDFDEIEDVVFEVTFRETPNSGSCPDGNPQGTICDDWFEFSGDLRQEFKLGKNLYRLEIFGFCPDNGSSEECEPGRLFTGEGEQTIGLVYEVKEVEFIPAPGVLALIGVGLAGLGYARRRQVKA
jgi:hypothetical protein